MTDSSKNIEVRIKYRDIEQTISASSPDEAWNLLAQFFTQFLPSFEVAQRLWLRADLKKLAEESQGIIAFSKEGANVLLPKNKMTDNETLMLWLLASYLGHGLGLLDSDALSKEELQAKLGKTGKITSTRLGELAKNVLVARTPDEKFRVTTFGVVQLQNEVIPRLKAKIGI